MQKNKNRKNEMRVLLKEMDQAITDAGFDAELIKNNFESQKLKNSKKYYKENEYGRKATTELMNHIRTYNFFYSDDATDFLVRIVSSGLTVKDIPDGVLINIAYASQPITCFDVARELNRRAGMPESASENEWRRSADIINKRNRTAYEKVIKAKKEKREKEEEFFNSIDNDEKALNLLVERAKIDSIDEMYKRKDFRTAVAMYKLVEGYAGRNASMTAAERLAEFRKKYSLEDIINFLASSIIKIESAEKYIALAVVCEAARHHNMQKWLSSEWVAIKAIGCHEDGEEDFFDLCDDYDNDKTELMYSDLYDMFVMPLLHDLKPSRKSGIEYKKRADEPFTCTLSQLVDADKNR